MDQDQAVEKPMKQVLFRQSSVEIRVYPSVPHGKSSDSESSTDEDHDCTSKTKSQKPKVSFADRLKDDDKSSVPAIVVQDCSSQHNPAAAGPKIPKSVLKKEKPRKDDRLASPEHSVRQSHLSDVSDSEESKMASPGPKSPRSATPRKDDKEESFWDKIGTLGRKKKIKEVQEVQEEGKNAIDSPGNPMAPALPPEEYALEENEERSMIEPRSLEDPKFKALIAVLVEWINDELAEQRIIVQNLDEDLYDGQVLQKLLEKLTGQKLDVPEVTQSEENQKNKLRIVLNYANRVLGVARTSPRWSVESVHSKNVVSILHLLVSLARQFRAPVRLPENVVVNMVVVQKRDGILGHRIVPEEITSTYDDLGLRCERDAFDTLFDHAPDKLQVVKKSLVTFVNKQLNKIHLEITDLDTQLHDGVYLILLMGLLEGYFVPLHEFHLTPKEFDHKVHNVAFAFELMQEAGLPKPKARPEDIVNLDLKSTLRVLYNLFTKYKHVN